MQRSSMSSSCQDSTDVPNIDTITTKIECASTKEVLAHEGDSGDSVYANTSNSQHMSTHIVDSALPIREDERQTEIDTHSQDDAENSTLKIENNIITHNNSLEAHSLSYGTSGNNYSGCKLRPIEERNDVIESLEVDINNLYAKAAALVDELERSIPTPTPAKTTNKCETECEHDGGRLRDMFARFLNHSSIFGRTIKTYEYAYGASDHDGSEGEPPLPPSILKRYYVPVCYTIRAAPMDSGCTTTTFAHSDGFTNTWESTSRLRVADQKTHKPDFEGSASVLIYTRPGKTTPLTIERALHCPKVTTLFSAKSLVRAGHEVCLRLNQPGLKMVDGSFVPLVDYDGLFWLVYLVPDSNYILARVVITPAPAYFGVIANSLTVMFSTSLS